MSDYCIVVAVSNPASVDPLTRMGCSLARANDGRVAVASVTEIPAQLPVTADEAFASKQNAIVERALSVADSFDVPADGMTPPSHNPDRSIVSLVDRTDAAALLVGARELVPFRESLLGRTVLETVIERVSCDVYVEQIGPEPAVPGESILVPVAEGAHADAVTRVASAVGAVHDMRVHLVTVVPPTADARTIERTERRLRTYVDDDPEPIVDVEAIPGDPVVETLVDLTGEHDLTVLGATDHSTLAQFLSGTVPAGLTKRSQNTLLMVDSGR